MTTEPPIRMELLSQARYVSAVRAMVAELAERIGFPQPQCSQISLAVDEALSNVIKHGYDRRPDGRIWITIWHVDGVHPSIRIVIEDHARQVDPDVIKSRNLDDIRPGGLGVHIIQQVMDEAVFEKRSEGGMRLIMTKHLTPLSQTSPRKADPCGTATDHS